MKRHLVSCSIVLIMLVVGSCNLVPVASQPPATTPPPTLHEVPAGALVIHNGTVITGTGAAPIEDGIVVIQGERIVSVGPRSGFAIPASVQVVDASGGTILPGIINAHVHGAANAAVRRVYFLLKGVTSVCDMGSPLEQMPEFARDHRLGPAARGFKSGPIITVPGGYPDSLWHGHLNYEVSTPAEAQAAVADLVDRGADAIKIALEPGHGGAWPVLDLQQVKAIVEEAHARGRLVRAHIGRSDGTDVLGIVLESGVDAVEHIPPPVYSNDEAYDLVQKGGRYTLTPADEAQLARLAEHHVIMVPTMSAYTPWCETLDVTSEQKQTCYELFQEPVRRFHALGGTVVVANDYGADAAIERGVPLREMQLFVGAGLAPMEVIEASTRDAARVCGHGDELGTLEPGKLADVVIVDGDALASIDVMSQVLVVIKGGQVAFPF